MRVPRGQKKYFAARAIGDRFRRLPITRTNAAMAARTAAKSTRRGLCFALLMLCAASFALAPAKSFHTEAQSSRPLLISEDSSTRGVAIDSVTRKHEPFS